MTARTMTATELRQELEALPTGTSFTRDGVLELLARVTSLAHAEDPSVLTVEDLAHRWSRSASAVRALCTAGRIAGAFKLPGGAWRIPLESVQAYERQAAGRAPDRTTPRPTPSLRALARGDPRAAGLDRKSTPSTTHQG